MFWRKQKKHKYINGTKGVISLFLCIVLVPFLTVASVLIELSRYQGTAETVQETMDCSSLSTLANYDKYLQERFGLFALSQNCDINKTFNKSFNDNVSLLGKGVTVNGASANGTLPFSNRDILKAQVLDFSESTVLTEILLDDLNLEQLLNKLNELKGLEILANVTSKVSDISSKAKTLVKTGQTLISTVNGAVSKGEKLQKDIDKFTRSVADFYKKLNKNKFEYDENNEDECLAVIAENYLNDIQKIYSNAKAVINSANDLQGVIKNIPQKVTSLKKDLDALKATMKSSKDKENAEAIDKSVSSNGNGNIVADATKDTNDVYQIIIEEMEKALTTAQNSFKTETEDAFKNAISDMKSDLKSGLGLDVTKRYDPSYYSIPLSQEAKDDLKKIISEFPSAWENNSYNQVIKTLKQKFVPKMFDMNIGEIKNTIKSAVDSAKDKFAEAVKSKIGNTLTTLVNAVKGLFDLDLFYDGGLDAYLSDECAASLIADTENGNNPYRTLLLAIQQLLQAAEDFTGVITRGQFFGIISGVIRLMNSVTLSIKSMIELTSGMIRHIKTLVGYASSGNWNACYELLLVAGYMTHNLPNRTTAGNIEVKWNDKNLSSTKKLKGKALTGYPYSKIKVPSSEGSVGIGGGLSGLVSFLSSAKNGGSDTMFKGAELEYILAGTQSEIMNQTVGFMQLYMLRLLMDVPAVFMDRQVAEMAGAANIACWAVYLLVLVAEPLCDTVILVNGGKTCFLKNSCYLTPSGVPELLKALANIAVSNEKVNKAAISAIDENLSGKLTSSDNKTFKKGGVMPMDYDTHMLIILMFSTEIGDMLGRFANIVQLESAYYYKQSGKGSSFDINKTYTNIEFESKVDFNSFISVFQTDGDSAVIKSTLKGSKGY